MSVQKKRQLKGLLRRHEACHFVRDYIANFANPVRLRILCELALGECTVSELIEATGVRQSTVSQHLKQLRLSGLVGRERSGNQRVYRVTDPMVYETMEFLGSISERLLERGTNSATVMV